MWFCFIFPLNLGTPLKWNTIKSKFLLFSFSFLAYSSATTSLIIDKMREYQNHFNVFFCSTIKFFNLGMACCQLYKKLHLDGSMRRKIDKIKVLARWYWNGFIYLPLVLSYTWFNFVIFELWRLVYFEILHLTSKQKSKALKLRSLQFSNTPRKVALKLAFNDGCFALMNYKKQT